MIKVAKKFIVTNEQCESLIKKAVFLSSESLEEIYYDNSQYSLTIQDIWLHSKNGKFYLKLPIAGEDNLKLNQYEEIEGEEIIRGIFAVPEIKDFISDIAQLGHHPFCKLIVLQKKYTHGEFEITIEDVSSEDFSCLTAEVALMVDDENHDKEAIEKILEFAKNYDLRMESFHGNVIEYLKRNKPEVFEKMLESGALN